MKLSSGIKSPQLLDKDVAGGPERKAKVIYEKLERKEQQNSRRKCQGGQEPKFLTV